MTQTVTMSIRIDEDLKHSLEIAAQADHRTLNNLIQKVLADWLQDNQTKEKTK